MLQQITCPACQQVCQYDTDQVQTQIRCPNCHAVVDLNPDANPFTVPVATAVANPNPSGFPPPSRSGQVDPAMRFVLPVDVSPLAIAAGYMGLFAACVIPAPIAMILGFIAIRKIKNSDGKLHGLGRAWFGVIMGAIFMLIPAVLFVIGLING